MANFQTNNSRVAVVQEVTEGTLLFPTAAGDYVEINEGFSTAPSIEQLENNALSGSIGESKSTVGLENPTADFELNLKHSGTESTTPQSNLLIKAALGDETASFAEQTTTSGSTVSVVELAAGGSNYERGHVVLVKDSTNGYSIRPVLSISSNSLTLGLNLSNAPATGITVGRPNLFKPGTSHPSLSVLAYIGNGASIEGMAGMRPASMTTSIEAGQFIVGSFSLEGTSFEFNPIEITASTDTIDFTDDAGTVQATLSSGFYNPKDLATEVATKMNAVASDTITCAYSDTTGKFTIASDGSTTFSLLWNTGAGAAQDAAAPLGFDDADETGAFTYTSDNAQTLSSPQTPSFDSSTPLVAKNNEVYLGDSDDLTCLITSSAEFALSNEKAFVNDVCAESGRSGSVVTKRTITATISGVLPQYDVDRFHRFKNGTTTQIFYIAGNKDGSGNWQAGENMTHWMPNATIVSFEVNDQDGLVSWTLVAQAFVDSGLGEYYINFV